MKAELVSMEQVERIILVLRGQRVILDAHLAALYGVTTSNLNKGVSRNLARFPIDFMLQLSVEEYRNLKFQSGTSSWGGTRKPPRAFTEQGVAMMSSVLRSAAPYKSTSRSCVPSFGYVRCSVRTQS